MPARPSISGISELGDIIDKGIEHYGYVVIGFFTPDYRGRAEAFSANLREYGIPHHLYAAPAINSWQSAILLKPSYALKATGDYDPPIVQMDVDCRVCGALRGLVDGHGDVGLKMRVKVSKQRALTWPSSRVVVYRNHKALKLIDAWGAECRKMMGKTDIREMCDEQALMRAIAKTTGVSIDQIPDCYAGFETGDVDGMQIVSHDSAHDTVRFAMAERRWFKRVRRKIVSKIVGVPYTAWKYGD